MIKPAMMLLVLALTAVRALTAEGAPEQAREIRSCKPASWALSSSKEWVIFSCELGGNGLVDDFSLDTDVFLSPVDQRGGEPLSITARDWSVSPADDVLWYVDEATLVRRLILSQVAESNLNEAITASPRLDLAPLEPSRILGLSASTAVLEVADSEGPRGIHVVTVEANRIAIQEYHSWPRQHYWAAGSPISPTTFATVNRLGAGSYSIEYWEIGPLAREWVIDLPVGIEPRDMLPGQNGRFLLFGCPAEPSGRPFLAIFDPSGAMGVVEVSETCRLDLLNPCPAVVGGTWEDDHWRVWLELGPRPSKVERLQVDSSGAACFFAEAVDWHSPLDAAGSGR